MGFFSSDEEFYGNKLIKAAEKGDLQKVRQELAFARDKSIIHYEDDAALRSAAEAGHTDVVGLLLDRGANINACNGQALYLALRHGHAKTAQLLLDRGAGTDNPRILVWLCADHVGYKSIIDVLLPHIFRPEAWLDKTPQDIDAKAEKFLTALKRRLEGSIYTTRAGVIEKEAIQKVIATIEERTTITRHEARRLQLMRNPFRISPPIPNNQL